MISIQEVNNALRRVHKGYFHVSIREFEEFGLSIGMARIMKTIDIHPEYNQKTISEKLHFTESNMSIAIKKLKDKGYIETKCSPSDKRANMLILTELGKKVVDTTTARLDEITDSFFTGFSESELKCFKDYLTRLGDNIERIID